MDDEPEGSQDEKPEDSSIKTDLAAMLAALETEPAEPEGDHPLPHDGEIPGEPVLPEQPDKPAQLHETRLASVPTGRPPNSLARPSQSYEAVSPNWAVEATDSERTPLNGFACTNCPEAGWLTGRGSLECFCRVMRIETWSTARPRMIEVCTLKEQAVLALQAETMEAGGPEEP